MTRIRRLSLMLSAAVVVALASVSVAAAAPPSTLPAIPVDAYGQTLLTQIMEVASDVLPWAAVFTAVGIGFAFLKGWIGRRKASSVAR